MLSAEHTRGRAVTVFVKVRPIFEYRVEPQTRDEDSEVFARNEAKSRQVVVASQGGSKEAKRIDMTLVTPNLRSSVSHYLLPHHPH